MLPTRIRQQLRDVVSLEGRNWERTQVWETNDLNQGVLVSEQRVSQVGGPETHVSIQYGRVTTTVIQRVPAQQQRLVTVTHPDGSVTEQLYTNGLLARISRWTDSSRTALLSRSDYAYDPHDRQAQVIDARNGVTLHVYNAADLVVQTIQPDPDGAGPLTQRTTTWTYDALLRATNVTYPGGRWQRTRYTPQGLVQKSWGMSAWPVEYGYDHAGRLTNMVTWQQFNLASGQGSGGEARTAWLYDTNRGWLVAKWYADPSTGVPSALRAVQYSWTPAGRLASRRWTRGVLTTYGYNAAGELETVHYSDGTPGYTNRYDRRGRVYEVVQGTGRLQRWYTDAGEVTSEGWVGGDLDGVWVTNLVDTLGRRVAQEVWQGGSRLSRVDYSWGGGDRLLSVSDELGHRADYEWETLAPMVRQVSFKQGGTVRLTVSRSFDLWNRLTNIQSVVSTGVLSGLRWTYDELGRRVRATWADGSWWVYTYDLYGQLVSGRRYWADGRPVAGQQFEYRHDAIGNRTAGGCGGDELGQSLRWSTNTVNRLNQYTSRTVPGYVGVSGEASASAVVTLWWGSNEWARAIQQGRYWYGEALVNNATGSVWVVITNLGVVRNQPDRLQSETRSAFVAQTPELLIHDLDGNLVRDGRWMYSWDGENRLTRVITVAGPASSFRRVEWKYDTMGRRVRQTSYVLRNGLWQVVEDLKFVSDPELFGRHVAEFNATNNALVRAYVWGLDLSETLDGAGGVGGLLWVRMATGPAAGTHFVCYDGNGNVWNLVSASTGTETARYEYGPFGEPLRISGPAARFNPFRFSTKRTEDFTGLVLYEYRAYSPTLGRWLSRDPIEERAGASLLALVENEPVDGFDAHGLLWPGYPDMPGTPKPPPTPRPPEPQYPEGFAICTRPVAVDGVKDIAGKVANCCGGEHTFIQYVRYPTPPAEGPPFVWGWGFSGGVEATQERHFGATRCVTCQKVDRPLKHGTAARHGKTGKSATDIEIRECIMARRPDRRYSFPWYVCIDWAYQAAEDCGLKCR